MTDCKCTITNTELDNHSRIHLIGIGGCSMSGIARILKNHGKYVQGSDMNESIYTDMLAESGITVFRKHEAENVEGCDLVIYSAAIKPDNVEMVYAKEHGIPTIERCDALGVISKEYQEVVGISGCHGKTTITSMMALIAEKSEVLNATVHVGGYIESLNGGVRIGNADTFITEACEYVRSFLSLSPTTIVLNNIDNDHLDCYRDIDDIVSAFQAFIDLMPQDKGYLIANIDDVRVKQLYDSYIKQGGHGCSYSLHKESGADYYPANIEYNEKGFPKFDIMSKAGQNALNDVKLTVIGEFNIQNALAAAACALHLGADCASISEALAQFVPAKRRFEHMGEKDNIEYYHDYAHHPGEIRAVLCGAKRVVANGGKLIAVFQCNSYTRARTLFLENVDCFESADIVLVPEIYKGREGHLKGTKDEVFATQIVNAINKYEHSEKALHVPTFAEIKSYLHENAKSGDLVITLGSGDVYTQTQTLLED